MADPFRSLTRHQTYYIPSADLSFLLGHVQFRVHRYFFERESAFFRGKLTMPMSPGSTRQGSSDGDPLVLENVRPEDFERFLWVFYNPRYSLYDAKVDDWSIILSLSHRWGFAEVKSLAVRELEKKDFCSIDRIVFYQANDVDRNLLIPHFAKVCSRENPLTLVEGIKLGMETTLVIASAREYIRAIPNRSGGRTPTSPTVDGEELYDMIRELFNIPRVRKADEKPTSSSGGLPERTDFKTTRPQAPPLPPTPPQSQHEGMRPRSPPPPPLPQKRPPVPESPTPSPKLKLKPEVSALQTAPKPPPPTVPLKTEPAPKQEEPSMASTATSVPPVEASSVEAPPTATPSTPTKTTPAQRKALRREKPRLQKLKETETSAPSPQPSTPQANEPPESLEKPSEEANGAKTGGSKGKEREVRVEPKVEERRTDEVKAEEDTVKVEVRAPTPVQEVATEIEEAKEEDARVEAKEEDVKTKEAKEGGVKTEEPSRVEAKDETRVEEPVETEKPKDETKQEEEPKFELKVEEVKTGEVAQDLAKGAEMKADAKSEEPVKVKIEAPKVEEPKVEGSVEVKDEVRPTEEAKLEEPAKDDGKADATDAPQDTTAEQKLEDLIPDKPSYARSEAAESADDGFATPSAMRSRASSFGRWGGESDAEVWADAEDGAKASHPDIEGPAVAEPVTAEVEGEAPKTPTIQKAELEPPATEEEAVTPVATEQVVVLAPETEKVATDAAEPAKPEEPTPAVDAVGDAKNVDPTPEPTAAQTNGDAEVAEVKEPAPVEGPKVEEPSKVEPAEPTNVEPTAEPPKVDALESETKPEGAEGIEKQSTAGDLASQAGENDQADVPKANDNLDAKAKKALKKAAKKKAKKATAAAGAAADAESNAEQIAMEAKAKAEEEEKKKADTKKVEEARQALEEAKRAREDEEKKQAEVAKRKAEEDNQPLIDLANPHTSTPTSKAPLPPVKTNSWNAGNPASSPIKKGTSWGDTNSRPSSPVVMPRPSLNSRLSNTAGTANSKAQPRASPASPNNRGAQKKEESTSSFGSFVKGWL